MRVLIVSQYFWPESFRINELALAMQARGVEVEVLTGKPNYPVGKMFDGYRAWGCSKEQWKNVPLHRLPLLPRGKGAARLALNYLSFIVSGLIFGPWLLRKQRFDVIFVFGVSPILQAIPALWLGRRKKCPVLIWVQDLWPESLSATGYVTHPSILKSVECVVKMIYRNVDLLLVQSRAFLSRVRPLADSTPVVYYPNSFIEEGADAGAQATDCPGMDSPFPVLFAGNIGTAQAVEVILDAATLLRNASGIRFVIVGEGTQRAWMMEEAARRGLDNIVFPGRYPVEAMPDLMRRAGVLLVTLTDSEIFRLTVPSKIQAYLAAGRPIIASLNGAGAEIIEEAQAGMSVAAEDPQALSEAIMALHALPAEQRNEMGKRGRRYYDEHFSHDKLVGELIDHLKRVVHQRKGQYP